jgi:hypothetical protein
LPGLRLQQEEWLSKTAQDLRFALRVFQKNPAFTLAAILSVAIGVGAAVAVFSVVNALLLKPLPYQNADRLVIVWNTSPGWPWPSAATKTSPEAAILSA